MAGGKSIPIWVDRFEPKDGRDNEAFLAFQKIAMVSTHNAGRSDAAYLNFSAEVVDRMKDPPFFCTSQCEGDLYSTASEYAGQLYDAMYAYGRSLNATLTANSSSLGDGLALLNHIAMKFDGMSGVVEIGKSGTRYSSFYMNALTKNGDSEAVSVVFVKGDNTSYTPFYDDESLLWFTRGGRQPPAVPRCGFQAEQCPPAFLTMYLVYVVMAAVIVVICVVLCVTGIAFAIVNKRAENARLNQLWQISFDSLGTIGKKEKAQSFRSLQSSNSSDAVIIEGQTETRNYIFFTYEKEPVAALKHDCKIHFVNEDASAFRKMRQIENNNLNRFIGICMDSPKMMSVWRYCSRGSINDVVTKGSVTMDYFFIICLLRDIANGLHFIHNSFLQQHGYLTSQCCLVDDRWQVKVSDYGVAKLRAVEKRAKQDLLWTAPEILRAANGAVSKEGDIYSFGIICAEVVTRSGPWDLDNRKENPEEIIYMVKKGGHNAARPPLDVAPGEQINPALIHLIRDCWAERASERPPIEVVKSTMSGMNNNSRHNLMDHVFDMLETYASTLEDEVAERTKELIEEKKKSDLLLYRMLPRQIADKLKLGQSVDPELYDSATVFFSDVVSFTTIAAKGTPLQVVNLLNNLYTTFDGIIDEHDVYKVETIGDAYLCVSGLPKRNGNEHVKEICSMSLSFIKCLEDFRIPYLPGEKLSLRIGLHTGSVVAGVVGLSMPRYCLFGDTVNTASRMESNGKPGMIHLSADANSSIQEFGGYETERRGEVLIKGKGVMETYWLIGAAESNSLISRKQLSKTDKTTTPLQ